MALKGSVAGAKTNDKLDTFLKRKLDPQLCEQIRYHESCIVVSDRYDKVFSYVVLGHQWIYITENPPKTVKEEVHYKNITSIELVSTKNSAKSQFAIIRFYTHGSF